VAREYFRIVRGEQPTLDDFKSQRDSGRMAAPPPGMERQWAEGVSVYDALEFAIDRAVKSRGRLGMFVARLVVPDDGSVEVVQQGNRHHHCIYAPPEVLLDLVEGETIPVQ
jgi:hypothetical protein